MAFLKSRPDHCNSIVFNSAHLTTWRTYVSHGGKSHSLSPFTSCLSSGVILDAAREQFIGENIVCKTKPYRCWKYLENNQFVILKKPANIESFTKDDQTDANEFNQFLCSVGKSTLKKTQLARKFNYVPAQDPCTPKNYAVADQSSFNTVECS